MSEAKHTPGPWSLDPEDKSIVGKDEDLAIATIENIDVGGDKGFHFGEESRANARLIATAPELLEALQLLGDVGCFEHGMLGNHNDILSAVSKSLSAIAKATGQPT